MQMIKDIHEKMQFIANVADYSMLRANEELEEREERSRARKRGGTKDNMDRSVTMAIVDKGEIVVEDHEDLSPSR